MKPAAAILLLVAALAIGAAMLAGESLADLFRVRCTPVEAGTGCGWGR